MAHKFWRQLFGMNVRGIKTSSQDDAKEVYKLDGRDILNFGKKSYKLNFVRAETSLAKVQLTLSKQANDGRRYRSPPGGVL